MKNRTATIVVIIVLVLVVVAAFVVYSNPSISSALGLSHSSTQTNAPSTTSRRFNGDRGGFVTGSIESLNDNGFIITMQDGTTKNIMTTSTTTIEDFASASSTPTPITSDQLSVGEQVRVIGASESDGSVSADRVMVGTLPTFSGYGRGGQGSTTPNATMAQ